MKLPIWISYYLTKDHSEKIEEAIASAERKTSGEIVPIVVRSSSAIGHVPIILLLIFLPFFLNSDLWFWEREWLSNYWWIPNLTLTFLIAKSLSIFPFVQRWLTMGIDRKRQVFLRAQVEFYQSHIHRTEGATGILLFVSLMEREAIILADKGIDCKVEDHVWRDVADKLVKGIKSENLTKGIIEAVDLCGKILSEYFPRQSHDQNELPNHLIIKE